MKLNNFKRQAIALVLLIFLSVVFTATSQAKEKRNFIQRFSIKLSSGLSYFKIGDINSHFMSGNERHADYAQYFNGLKKGELREIDLGLNSEIELAFDITSRFGIYFGSGYIYTRKESSSGFEVSPPEFYDVDYTFSPRTIIRAIPLKFGLYYIIPFGSKAKFFINGGVGYHFVKTIYYWEQIEIWRREDGSLFADLRGITEWNLSAKGSGYHGGIGFEYSIAKNLTLVLEVQGRSFLIPKLKGTEISLGFPNSESFYGSVFCFEKKSPITEKYYIGLGFYKEKPDYLPSPKYRNIRGAELDLSGYFLKIGIRIRLF